MPDKVVDHEYLTRELRYITENIEKKIDNVLERVECIADNRITREQMIDFHKPIQNRLELLEKIVWGVAAVTSTMLIQAVVKMIIE